MFETFRLYALAARFAAFTQATDRTPVLRSPQQAPPSRHRAIPTPGIHPVTSSTIGFRASGPRRLVSAQSERDACSLAGLPGVRPLYRVVGRWGILQKVELGV